ncbi:uncharacterized protein B0H64DRAFT_395153 [Chaetomium fimeti]|uniref:Uncharacterized protein n=1 Tax=Chaetomium fimeti TaxID=1854472 RepID=A0AAE0LSN4_9PEZI|nr:hypothetical protein B0H64DRAFT_395153 [Chaetomium fimeti]
MARRAPELKRFHVMNDKWRHTGPPIPFLCADLLGPLSRSQVAGTLIALGLGCSRLDATGSVNMGQFQALKVLTISARNLLSGHDLLIKLIRGFSRLETLVVDGADLISPEAMERFADAISRSECPTLRKVLLNPRDVRSPLISRARTSARLKMITEHTVQDLFASGNVKLFVNDGRRKVMAQWLTRWENEALGLV